MLDKSVNRLILQAKMAAVNIIDVTVLDNPTAFTNPLQFAVTFECLEELPDGIEMIFQK